MGSALQYGIRWSEDRVWVGLDMAGLRAFADGSGGELVYRRDVADEWRPVGRDPGATQMFLAGTLTGLMVREGWTVKPADGPGVNRSTGDFDVLDKGHWFRVSVQQL